MKRGRVPPPPAVTPSVHRKARTYGGNNNQDKIEQDAQNLEAAQNRDEANLQRIKSNEELNGNNQ